MTPEPHPYYRHRFPAEIISHAVWLYHVFSLSLRDIELILAERGVVVTHESVRLGAKSSVLSSPAFDYPQFVCIRLAPSTMSMRRDQPRHITVLPGGRSRARAR